MIDSVKLIEQLSGLYELSEETQDVLLSTSAVPNESQPPEATPSAVGLAFSVSTFVAQKNFHNFAVPRFAVHWGVVCDFAPEVRYLFHLLFKADTREVIFEGTTWKTEWSKHYVTPVGITTYDPIKVVQIGTKSPSSQLLIAQVSDC
jgi:hypothetical protein